MSIDPHRWGIVGYKDETGLGRLAQDFRTVLGLGRHLVTPSERLVGRALGDGDVLLSPTATEGDLRRHLQGLTGLIVLETHGWHESLTSVATSMRLKLVAVPMWEWFRGTDPQWRAFDAFACPSEMCLRVVRRYGFTNAVAISACVDLSQFPARRVAGSARVFVHNAGLVDHDDRKGTHDTIAAFVRVRCPDARLIVRLQRPVPMPRIDDRIDVRVGHLEHPSDLYREGDVAIQPSKLEGLGLMVLEPLCAGLPVITTDAAPMNEFVRHREMLTARRWFARPAFAKRAAAVKHAYLRPASRRDLARRIEWCTRNDLSAISAANRNAMERVFDADRLRTAWFDFLAAVERGAPLASCPIRRGPLRAAPTPESP